MGLSPWFLFRLCHLIHFPLPRTPFQLSFYAFLGLNVLLGTMTLITVLPPPPSHSTFYGSAIHIYSVDCLSEPTSSVYLFTQLESILEARSIFLPHTTCVYIFLPKPHPSAELGRSGPRSFDRFTARKVCSMWNRPVPFSIRLFYVPNPPLTNSSGALARPVGVSILSRPRGTHIHSSRFRHVPDSYGIPR